MVNELYSMIFKRRSFRKFSDEKLTISELEAIISSYDREIGTYKIEERRNTSCPIGDLCILCYGDKSDPFSIMDVGYKIQRLELYLQAKGIGVCWYGFGRTKEKKLDEKDFIIMLALGHLEPEKLRCDINEFKRNELDDIFSGPFDKRVGEAARLAPSACNSQPWRIETTEDEISVYRTDGNSSIMRGSIKKYFNTIDIGIFLSVLEVALEHFGYEYEKTMHGTESLIAVYKVK
jgi:nitroreductase